MTIAAGQTALAADVVAIKATADAALAAAQAAAAGGTNIIGAPGNDTTPGVSINLIAGADGTPGVQAGNIYIAAGEADSTASAGNVLIQGGRGASAAPPASGGGVHLTGADGTRSGGGVYVNTGNGTAGDAAGGEMSIVLGNAAGDGPGAAFRLVAGNAPGAGDAGQVNITAGNSGSAHGGNFFLSAGHSDTGAGGNVFVSPGTGAGGAYGNISLVVSGGINLYGLTTVDPGVADRMWSRNGALVMSGAAEPPLPLAFMLPGKPAAGAVFNLVLPFAVSIPAELAGAVVYAGGLATGNAMFTLNRISAGVATALGTVTITAASHVSATLAGDGGALAAGDVLQLVAPAPQNPTLADVGITVLATRA